MRTLKEKIQAIEWFNITNKLKEILLQINKDFAVKSNVTETITVDGKVITITNGIITNVADE